MFLEMDGPPTFIPGFRLASNITGFVILNTSMTYFKLFIVVAQSNRCQTSRKILEIFRIITIYPAMVFYQVNSNFLDVQCSLLIHAE